MEASWKYRPYISGLSLERLLRRQVDARAAGDDERDVLAVDLDRLVPVPMTPTWSISHFDGKWTLA